mgnify:FL=1
MSIIAGSAFSANIDAYHAGFEAVAEAMRKVNIEKPHLVVLFASVAYNQEQVVKGARDAGNDAPLIGCSTAGEITDDGARTQSVVALALWGDSLTISPGRGTLVKDGARAAGEELARSITENATSPIRLALMFPDVLTGNGAEVVRGMQAVLGEHFIIVGGAAGDDFAFKKTYQYFNDEVIEDGIVGVGIGGAFSIGAGVRHGWIPIGMPATVTRSNDTVVYEIDHKPAVALYEEYFGSHADEMRSEPLARIAITYPLGLKVPELEEYLIRDPITVGKDGSITCAAEIPEGSQVRLMIGSRERAIEAAQDAARKLMNDFANAGKTPALVFVFNCIAREKLFGAKASEEIRAVQSVIGESVPMVGFYTYGEQAPMGGEVADPTKIHTRFYNETLVLLGIGA